MENKTGKPARVLAIIGLILIAAIFCLLIYGAATHNQGLLMSSLFCLIIIPVLIYLFMMVSRTLKERKEKSK